MTRRLLWLIPLLLLTRAAGADPGVRPALKPQPAAPATAAEEPQTPAFVPFVPVTLQVPGDSPLYVIHAPQEVKRTLVYLHGWCGRPEAPEVWKKAAARHGTLVSLTAEVHCPNGRTRWHKGATGAQHERIQRAIQVVRDVRRGALDPRDVILVGYSQGAARAYRLAKRFPSAYPRLVLGGPPEAPAPGWFPGARAIAVLGGELETTEKMRDGTADLQEAGMLARYFVIREAGHGSFGPDAEPLMNEVFDWLLRVAP
jgi:pimeloyl-ACP methyl ester carboxylesterase